MSKSDDRRIGRIASLTIVNALIFQEVLAGQKTPKAGVRRVRSIRQILATQRPIDEFVSEWTFILDKIDYIPIFRLAREIVERLPNSPGLLRSIERLASTALYITGNRALLRHDLMGRVYHRLLADAKYFGAFYTKIPSATLLLKLTMDPKDWDIDWSNLKDVGSLRIADLACGTGTLLKASLQAIEDNYVRGCVIESKEPDLANLHKVLVENSLYGGDVLLFALHLTASALALHEPDVPFQRMLLFRTFLGGPQKLLGSLDMTPSGELPNQTLLLGTETTTEQVTMEGEKAAAIVVPKLDLGVMNPPFTRSVGGNLLFGSLSKKEREPLQTKLKNLVRKEGMEANITAGLGSVFAAIADWRIKPGGHLSLVLPRALTSGAAWAPTRRLIAKGYEVRYVVASHEPFCWNFSENTQLSECLVVARKVRRKQPRGARCVFVNLWERPKTAVEAVTLASLIQRTKAPDLNGKGTGELLLGEHKLGEAISQSVEEMGIGPWAYQLAFAQTDLCRAAYYVSKGKLYLPGQGVVGEFATSQMGKMITLGPDVRDVFDGFTMSPSFTAYPVFWNHDAGEVRKVEQNPNKHLSPLTAARKGRNLRDSELIWSRAGSLLLAERLWFKTHRMSAVVVSKPVLSNTWYPVVLKGVKPEFKPVAERFLALWLNSTLGLLNLFANRLETKGAWTKYKKPTWNSLMVPDPGTLKKLDSARKELDRLSNLELGPFAEIGQDTGRAEIDEFMAELFGMPSFTVLREMLGKEPLLTLKKMA